MNITQAVLMLKRFTLSVAGAIGVVVTRSINGLVIRTRDDDIPLDLCR